MFVFLLMNIYLALRLTTSLSFIFLLLAHLVIFGYNHDPILFLHEVDDLLHTPMPLYHLLVVTFGTGLVSRLDEESHLKKDP